MRVAHSKSEIHHFPPAPGCLAFDKLLTLVLKCHGLTFDIWLNDLMMLQLRVWVGPGRGTPVIQEWFGLPTGP